MRVILDTNVFVSAVFFSGPPARILATAPSALRRAEQLVHETSRSYDLDALPAGHGEQVLVSRDDGLNVPRGCAGEELVVIGIGRDG